MLHYLRCRMKKYEKRKHTGNGAIDLARERVL